MKVVLARYRATLWFVVALMIPGSARADEDALARAKQLYVSAAYDEALAALETVPGEASAADARTAAEYRLFCLLALDRKADARRAIEAMITDDPFHKLPEGQTSPRIRAVFDDIRRQIFPAVVQRAYADAKAAFDRKDPATAARFDRVLALLDDPDGRAIPESIDLRTVVAGFRDLSTATVSRRPPEPSPPAPASAAAPQPETAATSSAAVAAHGPIAERSPGFVAPVPVFQRMPQWQPSSSLEQRRPYNGRLELTIDTSGNVTSAKMQRAITPRYDAELLKAAMTWRFRPATMNGVPTTYVKVFDIQLQPK